MSTLTENEHALQKELEAELNKVELLQTLISRIDKALIMNNQSKTTQPPLARQPFLQSMWARVIRR